MDFVFVYGTLKRGFPDHETGLTRARFVARCRTREAYPLVDGGAAFEAWTYFKDRARVDVIHADMLEEYATDPRYVPAEDRTA